MSKEAMKLALEALENINNADNDRDFLGPEECCDLDNAITALREALAEQPKGRPVESDYASQVAYTRALEAYCDGLAEQPAQRTWVYLTDEERNKLWREVVGWGDPSHDDNDLMKAVEDTSRRKNT